MAFSGQEFSASDKVAPQQEEQAEGSSFEVKGHLGGSGAPSIDSSLQDVLKPRPKRKSISFPIQSPLITFFTGMIQPLANDPLAYPDKPIGEGKAWVGTDGLGVEAEISGGCQFSVNKTVGEIMSRKVERADNEPLTINHTFYNSLNSALGFRLPEGIDLNKYIVETIQFKGPHAEAGASADATHIGAGGEASLASVSISILSPDYSVRYTVLGRVGGSAEISYSAKEGKNITKIGLGLWEFSRERVLTEENIAASARALIQQSAVGRQLNELYQPIHEPRAAALMEQALLTQASSTENGQNLGKYFQGEAANSKKKTVKALAPHLGKEDLDLYVQNFFTAESASVSEASEAKPVNLELSEQVQAIKDLSRETLSILVQEKSSVEGFERESGVMRAKSQLDELLSKPDANIHEVMDSYHALCTQKQKVASARREFDSMVLAASNIADLSGSLLSIFGHKKEAHQVRAIADAGIKIGTSIAALAGYGALAGVISPLGAATMIASGVDQLISLNSKPQDMSLVLLEAIGELFNQISQIRQEMHERFDRIENELHVHRKILNHLAASIDQVSANTGSQHALSMMIYAAATRDISEYLKSLQAAIRRIATKIEDAKIQEEYTKSIEPIDKLLHKESIVFGDLQEIAAHIRTRLMVHKGEVVDISRVEDLPIDYFISHLSRLNPHAVEGESLANPLLWSYMALATAVFYKEVYKGNQRVSYASWTNLQEILRSGLNLQDFFAGLSQLPYSDLITGYKRSLTDVMEALDLALTEEMRNKVKALGFSLNQADQDRLKIELKEFNQELSIYTDFCDELKTDQGPYRSWFDSFHLQQNKGVHNYSGGWFKHSRSSFPRHLGGPGFKFADRTHYSIAEEAAYKKRQLEQVSDFRTRLVDERRTSLADGALTEFNLSLFGNDHSAKPYLLFMSNPKLPMLPLPANILTFILEKEPGLKKYYLADRLGEGKLKCTYEIDFESKSMRINFQFIKDNQKQISSNKFKRAQQPGLVGYLPDSDAPLYFNEHQVIRDGNCGFVTLGASRDEVADILISLAEDPAAREMLMEEIQEYLATEPWEGPSNEGKAHFAAMQALGADLQNNIVQVRHAFPDIAESTLESALTWLDANGKNEEASHLRRLHSDLAVETTAFENYAKREDVFIAYANRLRDPVERTWLGYKSATLYAKAKRITLYLWKASEQARNHLDLVASHIPLEPNGQIIHGFHTDRMSHFNLLTVQPLAEIAAALEMLTPKETVIQLCQLELGVDVGIYYPRSPAEGLWYMWTGGKFAESLTPEFKCESRGGGLYWNEYWAYVPVVHNEPKKGLFHHLTDVVTTFTSQIKKEDLAVVNALNYQKIKEIRGEVISKVLQDMMAQNNLLELSKRYKAFCGAYFNLAIWYKACFMEFVQSPLLKGWFDQLISPKNLSVKLSSLPERRKSNLQTMFLSCLDAVEALDALTTEEIRRVNLVDADSEKAPFYKQALRVLQETSDHLRPNAQTEAAANEHEAYTARQEMHNLFNLVQSNIDIMTPERLAVFRQQLAVVEAEMRRMGLLIGDGPRAAAGTALVIGQARQEPMEVVEPKP
ncbi:MAG: hypothetical protein K0R66_342 [Gammaproteobacteria bacterium]|jgi:hypothetical protein|nr:hypothetical protein [Gammaproteobacteria bacterium]